jgi:hypothetical protein
MPQFRISYSAGGGGFKQNLNLDRLSLNVMGWRITLPAGSLEVAEQAKAVQRQF